MESSVRFLTIEEIQRDPRLAAKLGQTMFDLLLPGQPTSGIGRRAANALTNNGVKTVHELITNQDWLSWADDPSKRGFAGESIAYVKIRLHEVGLMSTSPPLPWKSWTREQINAVKSDVPQGLETRKAMERLANDHELRQVVETLMKRFPEGG